MSRQVRGRQSVNDNWLDTSGFTHLAGDSLMATNGDDIIGSRYLACVVSDHNAIVSDR